MALSSLTLAYAKIGDTHKSRHFFNKAYNFIENNNDIFTKIYTLIYLGHSLIAQDKYKQSIPLLKQANDYCEKINSNILKPYALSTYGIALAKTGHIKEGLKHCKQALKLAEKNKLSSKVSQFEIWYAETLILQKNYKLATTHLMKARKLAANTDEKSILASIYYLLSFCHYKRASINKSLKYSKEAPKIAKTHHMYVLERKIQIMLNKNSHLQKEVVFADL